MDKLAPYITLAVTILILWHSVVSHWAIRGNELKHLKNKMDDVCDRLKAIEEWILKQEIKKD